jgi:hypothetical protein
MGEQNSQRNSLGSPEYFFLFRLLAVTEKEKDSNSQPANQILMPLQQVRKLREIYV